MRLIDADALKQKKVYCAKRHEEIVPVAEIDWMPTIDAVPVKHGRWINLANGICDNLYTCSECKETWLGIGGYNYCPNCGAKMDAKEDGEC